jgi:hypothetical protein
MEMRLTGFRVTEESDLFADDWNPFRVMKTPWTVASDSDTTTDSILAGPHHHQMDRRIKIPDCQIGTCHLPGARCGLDM